MANRYSESFDAFVHEDAPFLTVFVWSVLITAGMWVLGALAIYLCYCLHFV